MSRDDITDPRVVPRWVEAGVSGVPRAAEWDASTIVEVVDDAGGADGEISFGVLEDGSVVPGAGAEPGALLDRLSAELLEHLAAPFEAVAVRRGPREWFVGARRANLLLIDLPRDLAASEITVAIGPGGERSVLVDGEERNALGGQFTAAAASLEEAGLARHDAFVARATRAGGRWRLTVDPL